MSRSTLLYTHGGGRLGNQLLRFAHWIAWALEHEGEVDVLDFAFWPYAALFAQWGQFPGCTFPLRPGLASRLAQMVEGLPPRWRRPLQNGYRVPRLLHRLGGWYPGWQSIELDDAAGEQIELDDPGFLARVRDCPVTTCAGWGFTSWRAVEAHEAALRSLFRPSAAWMERGRTFMESIRGKHGCVIGVLIRQTDYRAWRDGRFCYTTEQYARWIRQLLDLRPGPSPALVIACDERQDPRALSGLPYFFSRGAFNEGGHWFESLVALSLCDLILSPPSTFAAAAAFIGHVPLLPLTEERQEVTAAQLLPAGLAQAARHPVFSLAVS